MNGIIELQPNQLIWAYIFVALVIIIVKLRKIPREKDICMATFRMTVQLILAGYVLKYIFNAENAGYTFLVISIMEAFAVFNVFKRIKAKLPEKLKPLIVVSLVTGTLISLVYFIVAVIRVTPWFEPRYFIPLAGMFVGNSMTAISLAATRLIDGMNSKKPLIETSLMLGATPKTAMKEIIDDTFDSAIMPTINSMVGMGIVFLPGMMTGQILSGTSPVTAIRYQIGVMLGILGSVAITVILFVQFSYKAFFNEEQQIDF